MLMALNIKNQAIYAADVKESLKKEESYYCPNCKNLVFLKKGAMKIAHFSHYYQTNCHVFSEGETKEHLEGKKLLYNWFVSQGIVCQLEAYLPDLNQRPDILIWINQTKAIAIEFQCSSISLKRMSERTIGYKKNGYDVFWILGSQFKLTKRITAFQRLFMYRSEEVTYNLFSLDVFRKRIHWYSNIQQQDISQKITFKDHLLELNEIKWNDILMIMNKPKLKESVKREKTILEKKEFLMQSHHFLNQARLYQTPEIVLFQKYIYQRGDSLISLPKEIYFRVPGEIIIKTLPHFWKYILLKWITAKSINSIVTLEELDIQMNQMLKEKVLILHCLPLLSVEEKKEPIYSYIQILEDRMILEKLTSKQWIVKSKAYHYKTEQEKINSFLK